MSGVTRAGRVHCPNRPFAKGCSDERDVVVLAFAEKTDGRPGWINTDVKKRRFDHGESEGHAAALAFSPDVDRSPSHISKPHEFEVIRPSFTLEVANAVVEIFVVGTIIWATQCCHDVSGKESAEGF